MAFKHTQAVEISLYGRPVGAVAADKRRRNVYAFEYYPAWVRDGWSISPLYLPLELGVKVFPELSPETWRGLPAALADSLPDRFGSSLIDAKLAEKGVTPEQITPLDRLSYAADRGMGALEFKPARTLARKPDDILDIAEMVLAARSAISGNLTSERQTRLAIRQLLSVGTSAGGARAKAVVNLDPKTMEIRSGQNPMAGMEAWLLKFDGVGKDDGLGAAGNYGRIEYAYSLMARDAGVDMPKTKLLEENGRAHFMVKRFDRVFAGENEPERKLHMQSLCALGHLDYNLIRANSYSSLIAVIRGLGLADDALTEAFRRMAFNYMAMNCDDHSKNFSFLADARGTWRLAPAYDITFAYNSQNIWLREHLMGVDGKFADVGRKDLLDFADRHKIPDARRTLKTVSAALANWDDYARRAGLPKTDADEIAGAFLASI